MADNALVFRFLAELLKQTMAIDSDTAFQAAVQAFANDLLPWLSPRDLAGPPRPEFSMFESVDMTEEDIHRITFTPEGLGLFRAWLRRQGIDPLMSSS